MISTLSAARGGSSTGPDFFNSGLVARYDNLEKSFVLPGHLSDLQIIDKRLGF